ncbi:MAG: hypothetical protein ACK55I_40425, partial [bacterium]
MSESVMKCAYLLAAPHDLLEEVHVCGVHVRQVRLAVLQQEVVELLLGLNFCVQLVYVHVLEFHLS